MTTPRRPRGRRRLAREVFVLAVMCLAAVAGPLLAFGCFVR